MTQASELYVCVATFQTESRGVSEWVQAGQIAEAGSWPVKHYPDAFAPVKVDYPASNRSARLVNAQAPVSVSPAAVLRRRGGAPRTERP